MMVRMYMTYEDTLEVRQDILYIHLVIVGASSKPAGQLSDRALSRVQQYTTTLCPDQC